MPCHAWPQEPREYVRQQMAMAGVGSYFSGIVRMSDGTHVEVSAPIPDELGRQIAALSVAYELMDKKFGTTREQRILETAMALAGGGIMGEPQQMPPQYAPPQMPQPQPSHVTNIDQRLGKGTERLK